MSKRGVTEFFKNKNVVTFFNPLICVDSWEKVSSALYEQVH